MRKKEKEGVEEEEEKGETWGQRLQWEAGVQDAQRRGQEDNKLEPPGDAEDDMRSGGRDRARGRSME